MDFYDVAASYCLTKALFSIWLISAQRANKDELIVFSSSRYGAIGFSIDLITRLMSCDLLDRCPCASASPFQKKKEGGAVRVLDVAEISLVYQLIKIVCLMAWM